MEFVIGILGGMGTYATIHLFEQYAKLFPAEKEWDRPRIIIDNRCTMPSRVRAFLYNENTELLLDQMTESMTNLVNIGCNKIILACNTSHLFLPKIYLRKPELIDKVVNIIKTCTHQIKEDGLNDVYLLGSEGTIESRIYQQELKKYNIKCHAPTTDEYQMLRKCIEAVKQNKYSKEVKSIFLRLVNRNNNCILGCTELPILYNMYKDNISCKKIYDPVFTALNSIHKEFLELSD